MCYIVLYPKRMKSGAKSALVPTTKLLLPPFPECAGPQAE